METRSASKTSGSAVVGSVRGDLRRNRRSAFGLQSLRGYFVRRFPVGEVLEVVAAEDDLADVLRGSTMPNRKQQREEPAERHRGKEKGLTPEGEPKDGTIRFETLSASAPSPAGAPSRRRAPQVSAAPR